MPQLLSGVRVPVRVYLDTFKQSARTKAGALSLEVIQISTGNLSRSDHPDY